MKTGSVAVVTPFQAVWAKTQAPGVPSVEWDLDTSYATMMRADCSWLGLGTHEVNTYDYVITQTVLFTWNNYLLLPVNVLSYTS